MFNKIRDINVPMTLFVLYVARLMILGTNIAEAIAIFAIAGLYGYYIYINKEQETRYSSVLKEINKIKDSTNALNLKVGIKKETNGQIQTEKRLF